MTSEQNSTTAKYVIECRHASGSSHWGVEPDSEFDTREEAEAAIARLEAEDDDGAPLEYRVVKL